jgi:hypothetical protein
VRDCNYQALDQHVADAIAFDAAARAAYTVTADASLQAGLEKKAENKVLMAISVDGTQEGGQDPLAPSVTSLIRRISR